jgi:hypothetical protein
MNPVRPVSTLVASSFLGVIAVASIVVGALMFFGAWATQVELVGPVSDIGTAGAVLIGALSTAFGVFAAVAARDEWEARPRGRVLGLITGLVTVLAAASTLIVGSVAEVRPLLFTAVALGVSAIVAVMADAFRPGGRPDAVSR